MIGRATVCMSLAVVCLSIGCRSQERLTSKATPCRTKEVNIRNSDFSRKGVLTAWCAECKGTLYQCVTNGERTRVECHESTPNDVCR